MGVRRKQLFSFAKIIVCDDQFVPFLMALGGVSLALFCINFHLRTKYSFHFSDKYVFFMAEKKFLDISKNKSLSLLNKQRRRRRTLEWLRSILEQVRLDQMHSACDGFEGVSFIFICKGTAQCFPYRKK